METPIRINVEENARRINKLHLMAVDILSRDSQRNKREWHLFTYELIETLIDPALPQLAGPLHVPAFYLPADRTGVMHSHQVVVSALVQNATTAGLRPTTGTPILSGVLADFLQQLIELDHPPYRRRVSRNDLGKKIEEAILGGSVRVDRSETIGYPHFTYQPKGWKNTLPLMNSSSMVSELAPVVLYLRHVVQPGDTLIIEEPESHLHPAMQVEFTRQIAVLVNAGVRVIVTTHSEWVLEELANIVQRTARQTSRGPPQGGPPGGFRAAFRPSGGMAVQAEAPPQGIGSGGSEAGCGNRPLSDRLRCSQCGAVQRKREYFQSHRGQ